MPKQKKKERPAEPMVVYECPYCGSTTLKSLIDIRNHDTWVCPVCGQVMRVA